MRKRSASTQQGDLNGFLDAGSAMNGELRFEDTFRIDGRFSGVIDAAGDLIIGERGEVEAEICARRVFISGTVRGKVRALEQLEITAIAKVYADLTAPSLAVEDGAFFEGRCTMEVPGRAGEPERNKVTPMPIAKNQR